MKTIEEAANDYALSRGDNDYMIETESAFMAGVEFAQRWIPVDEELPEVDTVVLLKKTIMLGGKHSKEVVTIGSCVFNKFTNKPVFPYLDFSGCGVVTHWRKIELV